jgi:hypothetical protein
MAGWFLKPVAGMDIGDRHGEERDGDHHGEKVEHGSSPNGTAAGGSAVASRPAARRTGAGEKRMLTGAYKFEEGPEGSGI